MLLHLPDGHDAEHVRDALIAAIQTLPEHLQRFADLGPRSRDGRHKQFTIATDIPVYFCDPASPWQRGSNENTNGLLRQYFPKGTDLPSTPPNTSSRRPRTQRPPTQNARLGNPSRASA